MKLLEIAEKRTTMKLPETYLITGEWQDEKDYLQRLTHCINKGLRLIQFRAPALTPCLYQKFAKMSQIRCKQSNVILLLNCDFKLFENLDGDGIHLSSNRLMSLKSRPLPFSKIVGASCHNEKEIEQASHIEVDFITVSPVAATPSHPLTKGIGWEQFARLAAQTDVPVFALGGVNRNDKSRVKQHGGYGIAGISAFWS